MNAHGIFEETTLIQFVNRTTIHDFATASVHARKRTYSFFMGAILMIQ